MPALPAQITIKGISDIMRLAALIEARMNFLSGALVRANTDFTPAEKHEFAKEFDELKRLLGEF